MSSSPNVIYRDRLTGLLCEERQFAGNSLQFLYGDTFFSRYLGHFCGKAISRCPWISKMIGYWYNRPASRNLIAPFIENFAIDPSIFRDSVDSFASFNAFFTRCLKPESRPIANGENVIVMPADGRYLFYPNLSLADGWVIKGKKFDLTHLLQSQELSARYQNGSMVIARLCPSDYHRFHFPCACEPTEAKLLNGPLDSVHPRALLHNLEILAQNKRYITHLKTENFGNILYIEIGAIGVGSVVQTYIPDTLQAKGAEKGFFEFGGSCVVLLFEAGKIQFDADLLNGESHVELLCLMGQSMGIAVN